jgi:hypothetical protein
MKTFFKSAPLVALLLGCAGAVHAAPDSPGCGQAGCSAGSIDPAAIREAVRETVRSPDRDASDKRQRAGTAPLPVALPSNSAGVWERRIGGPGEHEDYNCALSFGIGGTLGSSRFLATRVLGGTRVWRDE